MIVGLSNTPSVNGYFLLANLVSNLKSLKGFKTIRRL